MWPFLFFRQFRKLIIVEIVWNGEYLSDFFFSRENVEISLKGDNKR